MHGDSKALAAYFRPMYTPSHFCVHDESQMQALIRRFPLGALVCMTEQGLDANHLPRSAQISIRRRSMAWSARRNSAISELPLA